MGAAFCHDSAEESHMSARNRRVQRSEIERLVELDPPGGPASTPEAPEPARQAPAVVGVDDVRAPLLGEAPHQVKLGGPHLRRRDLLAWGGAAALWPAFSGVARAQETLAAAALVERPLSIGYVEGSDTWQSFKGITVATLNRGLRSEPQRAPAAASVVPATSLIVGDQTLAGQTVRVGVHGFYPIPNPVYVRSAYLTVFFPSDEPALRLAPLPFTPWGFHNRPVPNPAPPVKFVAPLGAEGKLDLLLEVVGAPERARRPSPAVGGRFTASFTVDWFEGRPRLQRGLYLLGLAPGTWSAQRALPMTKAGQQRPLELVSLMLSIDPVVKA
jgi:hypothetical protein